MYKSKDMRRCFQFGKYDDKFSIKDNPYVYVKKKKKISLKFSNKLSISKYGVGPAWEVGASHQVSGEVGCVDLGGRRNFWCPNPSLEPRYFSLSPKRAIELSI